MAINEKSIASVLDEYERKDIELKKKSENEHQQFLLVHSKAVAVAKEKVVPVLKQVETLLVSRGHQCKITEEFGANYYVPSVEMQVYPKHSFQDQYSINNIKFSFNVNENYVEITSETHTGHSQGKKGFKKYKIEELTQEIVEVELESYIHNIF